MHSAFLTIVHEVGSTKTIISIFALEDASHLVSTTMLGLQMPWASLVTLIRGVILCERKQGFDAGVKVGLSELLDALAVVWSQHVELSFS